MGTAWSVLPVRLICPFYGKSLCVIYLFTLRHDSITKTPDWPRSRAVTKFRPLFGYDCVTEHLYRMDYFLIRTAHSVMEEHHLFRSTALCSASENQKYWRPKGRMGEWHCQRTTIGINKQTVYDSRSILVCAAANVASLIGFYPIVSREGLRKATDVLRAGEVMAKLWKASRCSRLGVSCTNLLVKTL